MGLNTRVKRLEQAQEPQRGYHLYSPAGAILEGAEVITRATPEAEGLARLADGTEKAVIWQGKAVFVFDADILTEKLWWIRNDDPVFSFAGTGITEDDI